VPRSRLGYVGTIAGLAACNAPEAWLQKLNRIRSQMNMTRTVVLLESSRTQIPLVIGYARRAILLPVGLLTGIPAEQIELILMHELAHIRRADYLFNMLQTVVESIMFYNPAVWWISNVIRTERENCCDDIVIEITDAGPLYAAALTALEENRSNQMEVAMAATGGSLVKRIRRILRQSEPRTSAAVPMLSAAAVIVVIGGLLAAHPAALSQPVPAVAPAIIPALHSTATLPAATITEPPMRQTAVSARTQIVVENAYTRWLNEDVVYIITPEERAAFLGLSTDAERDRFIAAIRHPERPKTNTKMNITAALRTRMNTSPRR
jgi:hypothetical protein